MRTSREGTQTKIARIKYMKYQEDDSFYNILLIQHEKCYSIYCVVWGLMKKMNDLKYKKTV